MPKHIHVHIHRTVDGGMRVLDGDPYNRDENGQFATTSGGAAHHTKQAQAHRQHATSKGEGHLDHPDHIRAFSSHTRAAASLSRANEMDNTGKGRQRIPYEIEEAEREAQQAKLHERNLKTESAQGVSNAPKGGINWKAPGGGTKELTESEARAGKAEMEERDRQTREQEERIAPKAKPKPYVNPHDTPEYKAAAKKLREDDDKKNVRWAKGS